MSKTTFQTIKLNYTAHSTVLFKSFASSPYSIFLDSCSDGRKENGIDVIASNPYLRFISNNDNYEIFDFNNNLLESGSNSLNRLVKLESMEAGSLLGYFGYESNYHSFGLKKNKTENQEEFPDICIAFYSWRIEIDHQNQITYLKYLPESLTNDDIQDLIKIINLSHQKKPIQKPLEKFTDSEFAVSNFTKESYLNAFNKVQNYISSGDCYQVNLAQRFSMPFTGSTWQHYLSLRGFCPAPYACYLSTPYGDILSFSPESFLSISSSGRILSNPIKGTRKRHIDKTLDQKFSQELARSEKDKAENLMIVDLIRNDLSKSAIVNSVKVDKLFEIQSFANVHHMVSQVSAQKLESKSQLEVFLDCFPGGSITGAPKKRAMEIIRELEPHSRQVYCGAIGQINFEHQMDFNIAIRTILIKDKILYCWGGGGLVADSQGLDEYQETITKISNLIPIS